MRDSKKTCTAPEYSGATPEYSGATPEYSGATPEYSGAVHVFLEQFQSCSGATHA